MKESEITPSEHLRFQLLWDMLRLKCLDWRISSGESYLQPEREQLDAVVRVKLAIVRGIDKRIWGK